jgi:hypothetical protein
MHTAFDPSKNDSDGLSVYRERYHSASEVAAMRTKGTSPTWVVRLRASSILQLGLALQPDPRPTEDGLPNRPGHALISSMRSENRSTDEVKNWMMQLQAIVLDVMGGDDGFPAPVRD